MNQQQNIPDPDIFTKEIEDTIDNLFTPTRKIEIDPVTNEIKEVDGEDTITPKSTENETIRPSSEEELRLELEESEGLELKIEEEPEELPTAIEKESTIVLEDAIRDVSIEKMEHQFNQLYQSLLTLEWEITKEDLSSAYEILKNIGQKVDESIGSKDAILIINTMLRIMEALKEDPESVSPNAPKALEMGLKALMAIVREKDDPMPETMELLKKAKGFMALVKFGEDTKKEKEEVGPENAETAETVQTEPASIVAERSQAHDGVKDLDLERLQAAIEDLSNCVERIIPVQELLSKHQKSWKLYKFIKGIRERIESNIHVLCDELGIAPPEIRTAQVSPKDMIAGMPDDPTSSKTKEMPPFKEVMSTHVGDVAVAFLPEEIAYIGPTLGFRSKIKVTDGVFPLRAFKKWPWSKIKTLLTGELSRLEEKRLRSFTLPIFADFDDKNSLTAKTVNEWILIFKDGKGAALPIGERPLRITLDGSWRWIPETNKKSKWLGSLTSKDQTLKVISVEKIL